MQSNHSELVMIVFLSLSLKNIYTVCMCIYGYVYMYTYAVYMFMCVRACLYRIRSGVSNIWPTGQKMGQLGCSIWPYDRFLQNTHDPSRLTYFSQNYYYLIKYE